jgi:hypothetical protein
LPSHVWATPNRSLDSERAARGLRKRVAFALLGATFVNLQKSVSLATLGAACAVLLLGVHASPTLGSEPWLQQPDESIPIQIGGLLPVEEQVQDPPSKITFPNLPG